MQIWNLVCNWTLLLVFTEVVHVLICTGMKMKTEVNCYLIFEIHVLLDVKRRIRTRHDCRPIFVPFEYLVLSATVDLSSNS